MGTCQTTCCTKDNEIAKPNQKDEMSLQEGNPDDFMEVQPELVEQLKPNPKQQGTPFKKDREKFQVDNDDEPQPVLSQSSQYQQQHNPSVKEKSRPTLDAALFKDEISESKKAAGSKMEGQLLSARSLASQKGEANITKAPHLNCATRTRFPPISLDRGAVYEGDWLLGKRDGYGIQKWNDGSIYEGNWKADKSCGKGKLIHADGDMYEGDWDDDKANGKGVYIHVNGAKYQGDWLNDKQHGFGIEVWPDNARYEGEYKFGRKNGKGILDFSDGSRYEGEFVDNEIDGVGTYIWPDKRVYQGQWKRNKMHGKGQVQWPDGRKYIGVYILEKYQKDYADDKKHGKGVFEWGDGRKYEGTWINGKQQGLGVYHISDGSRKYGEWQDGIKKRWLEQSEIDKLAKEGHPLYQLDRIDTKQ